MKKIKLFMASPSDTAKERKVFTEVVNSINRSRAENEGFYLEPVLWEKYAYPEAENPQVIINKLLADAELVVVVFWNKFGAPTKNFPSGTMEELSLSLQKKKDTGIPSIKVYFRLPSPPKNVKDTEEQKKIFEVKETIKDVALYKDYSTIEEFKSLLHEHINAWFTDYISKPKKKIKTKPVKKLILNEPSECKSLVKDFFMKIEKKYDGEKSKLQFGMEDLDNVIDEIEDINFLLVGGEVASGKTTLLLTLAHNSAIKNRIPTLIFSMKSKKQEIIHRLLSSESKIRSDFLKRAWLKKEDWASLTLAAGRLVDVPLFFDDNPKMTIDDIRNQIARFKQKHKLGLVIIDGLNYIVGAKTKLGQELRLISREMHIPIVATAQVKISRKYDKRPTLDDLDLFGDIKEDADIIIFLYRGESIARGIHKNTVEIIIAKNNNGPLLTAEKYFLPEFCCFEDINRND